MSPETCNGGAQTNSLVQAVTEGRAPRGHNTSVSQANFQFQTGPSCTALLLPFINWADRGRAERSSPTILAVIKCMLINDNPSPMYRYSVCFCYYYYYLPNPPVQNRRKQQWLPFLQDRGLTPAIPPNEFLTPTNSKRLIKPRNLKDFKTTNIVTDHARNNPQSYRVDLTKTVFIDILFSPGLPSTGTK